MLKKTNKFFVFLIKSKFMIKLKNSNLKFALLFDCDHNGHCVCRNRLKKLIFCQCHVMSISIDPFFFFNPFSKTPTIEIQIQTQKKNNRPNPVNEISDDHINQSINHQIDS